MKRGFFSHQLCCGRSLLNKHILYVTPDNKIESILPFQREVSLTTFCEGLLLVVSPAFDNLKDEFVATLAHQLEENTFITVGEAVLQNSVYRRCYASDNEECRLYTITSICWHTGRLHQGRGIELLEVSR